MLPGFWARAAVPAVMRSALAIAPNVNSLIVFAPLVWVEGSIHEPNGFVAHATPGAHPNGDIAMEERASADRSILGDALWLNLADARLFCGRRALRALAYRKAAIIPRQKERACSGLHGRRDPKLRRRSFARGMLIMGVDELRRRRGHGRHGGHPETIAGDLPEAGETRAEADAREAFADLDKMIWKDNAAASVSDGAEVVIYFRLAAMEAEPLGAVPGGPADRRAGICFERAVGWPGWRANASPFWVGVRDHGIKETDFAQNSGPRGTAPMSDRLPRTAQRNACQMGHHGGRPLRTPAPPASCRAPSREITRRRC
jgi:hypothetical protein